MVVDDERDVRAMCTDVLEDAGFETGTAATCDGALMEMEENEADAMLLDIELPDEDGLSFLPRFKKLYPNVPVIMFTAYGYDEARMKTALENGAQGYVGKGAEIENMLVAVRNVLRESAVPGEV